MVEFWQGPALLASAIVGGAPQSELLAKDVQTSKPSVACQGNSWYWQTGVFELSLGYCGNYSLLHGTH